ncbi:MAG: DUF4085 domain-containing protein [Clostridia bacterium]|nr:DUF4085 domain-containing protein [Clostridia bacterium]
MKILTKEWRKDIDFHDLIIMLEPNTHKKIPFVFTDGGKDCVAKEHLHTIKTNFNLSEKENEISFVMLPDTIALEIDLLGDGEVINEKTCTNDFLIQYLNRLRQISYIPDDVLKTVKDKRLLALGYAEEQTKKEILGYIRGRYIKAQELYEKCCENSFKAEEELTIHAQFKKHKYIYSVPFLFDSAQITKVEKDKDDLYLTLDDSVTIVFSGAEIIEEEIDVVNSCVCDIELYKKQDCYELHLLIMKRDENLVSHYYYATYAFEDLKISDK